MKHYAFAGVTLLLFYTAMQYADEPISTTKERALQTPVSLGELIDKITILEIKLVRITDPKKRANVQKELQTLTETLTEYVTLSTELIDLKEKLRTINDQLWQIEDDIRAKEAAQIFDDEFITLARQVYFINDQRSATKRKINESLGSVFIEEKEYTNYDTTQLSTLCIE